MSSGVGRPGHIPTYILPQSTYIQTYAPTYIHSGSTYAKTHGAGRFLAQA